MAVVKAAVLTKESAVLRAHADYHNALAGLAAAQAEVERNEVSAVTLKREFERSLELQKRGFIAESEVDKARAAYETAAAQMQAAEANVNAQKSTVAARQAQVRIAEAEVQQVRTQVAEREAALNYSQVDLQNTIIRSPVDGVVIRRSIDVGQTVAASFNAPTLFTIAQDLRQMQVEANIDEADIGQIQTGQMARFTVDSFPGREFQGKVTQIRKASQTIQNVVTYTVVITADNSDQRLLPGMTANVQVVASERSNVVKIPNGALRFRPAGVTAEAGEPSRSGATPTDADVGEGGPGQGRPPAGEGGPGQRGGRGAERIARLTEQLGLSAEQRAQVEEMSQRTRQPLRALRESGRPQEEIERMAKQLRNEQDRQIAAILSPEQRKKFDEMRQRRGQNPAQRGQVWVLEKGKPKPVTVFIGVSDGAFSEMVRGDLKEGQEVIVGTRAKSGDTGRAASSGGTRRLGL